MMKSLPSFLMSIGVIFYFSSCQNTPTENPVAQNVAEEDSTSTANFAATDTLKFKYDMFISNIPIPFDILRTHESVPLTYNSQVLNTTTNLSKYSSALSKALNLGVYGADLAYCVSYNKPEETIKYLECVKKLTEDLGVAAAFNENIIAYYQKYSNNKDSIEKMVFESYDEIDKSLKSNERIGLASLVIAGGWVEGLYVTLNTLPADISSENQKTIFKKIVGQYNYLNMLIELLSQFKTNNLYAVHLNNLNDIKKVYEELYIKQASNKNDLINLTLKVNEAREAIISR